MFHSMGQGFYLTLPHPHHLGSASPCSTNISKINSFSRHHSIFSNLYVIQVCLEKEPVYICSQNNLKARFVTTLGLERRPVPSDVGCQALETSSRGQGASVGLLVLRGAAWAAISPRGRRSHSRDHGSPGRLPQLLPAHLATILEHRQQLRGKSQGKQV